MRRIFYAAKNTLLLNSINVLAAKFHFIVKHKQPAQMKFLA